MYFPFVYWFDLTASTDTAAMTQLSIKKANPL